VLLRSSVRATHPNAEDANTRSAVRRGPAQPSQPSTDRMPTGAAGVGPMARRLRVGRLAIYVEPRDAWVGAYVAPDAIYVCPLPFLVWRWTR
jgi:hypothetical protein